MRDWERDVEQAKRLVGATSGDIRKIWSKFMQGWDGQWCSETACCISYLGDNLDKIWVSNYAQGLVSLFKANDRFGHEPSLGAFVFFGYNAPEHTGRVIDITDKTVITVEGNIGGKVVRRAYNKTNSYIYGYGCPEYKELDMTTTQRYILDAVEETTLHKGMTEPEHLIKMAQAYLQFYGWYDGVIDGDYGSYTEKAARGWQEHDGREVTGEIRKADWEQIQKG